MIKGLGLGVYKPSSMLKKLQIIAKRVVQINKSNRRKADQIEQVSSFAKVQESLSFDEELVRAMPVEFMISDQTSQEVTGKYFIQIIDIVISSSKEHQRDSGGIKCTISND